MKHLPQIRLRTMFLFFACAAVGMTVYPGPIGWITPAFEMAVVIGLLQQARELPKSQLSASEHTGELSFARRYAIFWRIAISILLVGCIIWPVLLSKNVVTMPERSEIVFNDLPREAIPQLCILIALCNSQMRWRSVRLPVSTRPIRIAFMWALGIAVVLYATVDVTLMDFLVHRAIFGVERSQRYRRSDVYINLAAEGYDANWIGLGAVTCLLAALFVVLHFGRARSKLSLLKLARWLLFLLLLIPPAAFYIWYERYEFHRLSPDIAVSGLAITSFDSMTGALLAFVAVTAGAYQMGRRPSLKATISDDLRSELDRRAFHESFLGLSLLAAVVGAAIYSIVYFFVANYTPRPGGFSYSQIVSFCCYPTILLQIALIMAASQLLWTRWKMRNQVVAWTLPGISPLSFVEGWMMFALLLAVGIPTLRAFAFLLWLGPYNLLRLFGF